MTSPPDSSSKFSYSENTFVAAEESASSDWRENYPVLWGRRESILLTDSSTSSEETIAEEQTFDIERNTVVTTESGEDVERDEEYSEEFESLTGEVTLDQQDGSSTSSSEDGLENFLRKKIHLLYSRELRDPEQRGKKNTREESRFCFRKKKVLTSIKPEAAHIKSKAALIPTETCCQNNPRLLNGSNGTIENLKIENLMRKIQEIKEREFHNSKKCEECRNNRSKIASSAFVKRKLEIVRRPEFLENIQKHLYQKDSATLIAEIANTCPKGTTAPQDVWNRLLLQQGSTSQNLWNIIVTNEK